MNKDAHGQTLGLVLPSLQPRENESSMDHRVISFAPPRGKMLQELAHPAVLPFSEISSSSNLSSL